MCDTNDTTDTADQGPQIGNTKVNLRARFWTWTWNNYSEENVTEMTDFCNKNCKTFNFQREIGEECGTPHLQGFWEFANARYFSSLKKNFEKIHLEKARNIEACRDYCRKPETRVGETIEGGTAVTRDPLKNFKLRVWQQDFVNMIESPPDERTIHWYYDPVGNCGKTTLAKHLCLKYKNEIICLSGGPAGCKYGVMSFLFNKVKSKWERNDKKLRAAVFDFPRSVEDKVSYQALEEVKNGIFFNTKYESMMVVYDCPHVAIFANFLPDTSKLSADRWKIIDLSDWEAEELLDVM